MLQLDLSDRRALYEQIHDQMRNLIIAGALREGDKIPSVRDLATSLAINPNTIQKAYKDLETEGYIYTVRAKGSFVAALPEAVRSTRCGALYKRFAETVSELRYLGETFEDINLRLTELFTERGNVQ
ncbi:MAG: GntR family transcriptional regulator [Clostridia bacterium]|nr:GntR family transcriptional regulator [Clostridia bacterium]